MTPALLPFAAFGSQFALVFLLGFQVANVRDRKYLSAFGTSLFISISEIVIAISVIKSLVMTQNDFVTYAAFAFGGAFGIVTSMLVADFLNNGKAQEKPNASS